MFIIAKVDNTGQLHLATRKPYADRRDALAVLEGLNKALSDGEQPLSGMKVYALVEQEHDGPES